MSTLALFLRRLAILPIRLYQRLISPLTPPSCRFEPNCSEYGAQAVLAHGVVKGSLLTAWRILRCNPFTPGGLDPVPGAGRWRSDASASGCSGTAIAGKEGAEEENRPRRTRRTRSSAEEEQRREVQSRDE